jgi:hypothetical protein
MPKEKTACAFLSLFVDYLNFLNLEKSSAQKTTSIGLNTRKVQYMGGFKHVFYCPKASGLHLSSLNMSSSMGINQVLQAIEKSEGYFKLKFVKSDGSVSTRNCKTRIKHKTKTGKAPQGSKFKYSLRDTYSLLLDVEGEPHPKTIKVFGLLGFNDCQNIVF